MYYVPVTEPYYRLPVSTYVPLYSTVLEHKPIEIVPSHVNENLTRVQRELADLREELHDLRLEQSECSICTARARTFSAAEECSICSARVRRRSVTPEPVKRTLSPIHYCSICDDYVIDSPYPPPLPITSRSSSARRVPSNDKLSEYLSRQIDLQRLRQRQIPETRPVWIPTAYKHNYPHRRWATRHAHFSEP